MPLASPKYAFTEWVLAGAPDDPGLYALYDGDRLVCIGVAAGRGEIPSNPLQRRAECLAAIKAQLRCEELLDVPGDLKRR